ncbi:Stealth CR1 domain-containing protein [Paeniglutamicibacter sp. NPDC012692]|uniref:Stealth CR1 domain-containing protein n=1 Tax=Paeniglutamicibacter sp. NPDC012692 TaxID=3364388 RepID=UPI0036B01CA6
MSLRSSAFKIKERVTRAATSHMIASRPGAASDGFVKAGTRISPVLARSSNSLRLPDLREDSATAVAAILDAVNIEYWSIDGESNAATTYGVSSSDAGRLVAALSRADSLQHWYSKRIAPNGNTLAAVYRVGDGKMSASWAGISLYEVVVHEKSRSFGSGARQGVRILFWDRDAENKRVVSRVWNGRVAELPDPKISREKFETALQAANRPLADQVDFPIDAVYTWVDGTDEDWQRLKAAAQNGQAGESLIQDALAEARFADHDELRYSLRSIEQYAPWIRKIWIVTNGQVPAWLDTENPKIQVVSHEEIWPTPEGLPNFNSHAIEACLHRIDGLAEHYLYFNDDMILGRPVSPSRFFHGNGVSKYFYSRALVDFCDISEEDNASTIAAKNAREAMKLQGASTASRKFFHTPSPLRRSVTERLEVAYPELFAVTRRAQFREQTDIAVAGSFYFNVAGAMGAAVPARIGYDYIDPAIEDGRQRMLRVIAKHDKDTICVNDGSTEETDEQRIETDAFIRRSLEEFLPVASRFEKTS